MLKHALRSLASRHDGVVTVELALLAPMLAVMVIGISDISTAYGRKLELEQAAQRAIEKVMQTTGDETVEDTIKKEACIQINGADGAGECKAGRITTGDVTVTYRLECAGELEANYATDCDPGETEVRYILATVNDTYTPLFPIHFNTNADGTYHLSVTAGVRVK